MKKKLGIFGVVLFLAVGLSGCTETINDRNYINSEYGFSLISPNHIVLNPFFV